jgi:hypothetical protein
LFDQEGMMKKSQKSELVREIEMTLSNDDERVLAKDSELQTVCMADVMTNIRKIKTSSFFFSSVANSAKKG